MHFFRPCFSSPLDLQLPEDHSCFAHRNTQSDAWHRKGVLCKCTKCSSWLSRGFADWLCLGKSWSPAGKGHSRLSGSREAGNDGVKTLTYYITHTRSQPPTLRVMEQNKEKFGMGTLQLLSLSCISPSAIYQGGNIPILSPSRYHPIHSNTYASPFP